MTKSISTCSHKNSRKKSADRPVAND